MKLWTSLLLLCVLATSLAIDQREIKGKRCPDSMIRKFSSSYIRHIYRYMDRLFFTSPTLKERVLRKTPEFKRKLLVTEFKIMDTNRNGLVDGGESVSLFNRLWRSRRCVPQFLNSCDADKDGRVSPMEWTDCFGIEKCKKSCPRNKIDRLLCVCLCKNTAIEGLVLSYRLGVPLKNANVLLKSSALATWSVNTNSSGHFKTYMGTCDGDISMTIDKKGYSEVRLDMAAIRDKWYRGIEMKDAELPSIVVHPRSRNQQRGDNVTLKCQAEGDPPMRIEWYHNGLKPIHTTYGTSSRLFIPNVDNRAGSYKCRAVNQHGSEYSRVAELNVIEPTEDSCPSKPIVSSVKLPPGCMNPSNGNDVLNIGRCSNEQCTGRRLPLSKSGICSDEECCCGPLEMEAAEVKCMGVFGIKMMRVTKCGCGRCEKRETVVKGLVVGGPEEHPANYLNVIRNGKQLAITDKQGLFQIVVPHELERLVITFKDRYKRYADTTMAVPFEQGRTVFHKVKINLESPPVEFQTSEELTVPLGHTRDGSSMAELEVPANNFVTPHGKPYKGQARLRLSFTDPRNESDILSAPGDFSTVDEMGEVQPLKSYGMIRMSFEDNRKRQLGLINNVKVFIDAEKLSNLESKESEPAPKLWWLDEKTGRWRDAGPIKPVDDNDPKRGRRSTGRKFLVGEIETDKLAVINIDVLWKRCYVRVETFVSSDEDPEPAEGVEIRVVGQDVEDQFYGYTNAVTGPNGVSCLPVWCNAGGFIQAERLDFALVEGRDDIKKSGISLVPDESNLPSFPVSTKASVKRGNKINSFYFTAVAPEESTGPIFANDELITCRKSGMKAFRFYYKKEEEIANKHFDMRYPPEHRLAWYPADRSPKDAVQKCFLKVNIKSVLQPNIMLESFTSDGREKYGFIVKKVTKAMALKDEFGRRLYTTCLEYRCSEPGKSTMLRLTMISNTCYLFSLSPKLLDEQVQKKIRDNEVQVEFTVPEGKVGKHYGTYTGRNNLAENQCNGGTDKIGIGVGKQKFDGEAVLAYPGWECPHIEEYETFQ